MISNEKDEEEAGPCSMRQCDLLAGKQYNGLTIVATLRHQTWYQGIASIHVDILLNHATLQEDRHNADHPQCQRVPREQRKNRVERRGI